MRSTRQRTRRWLQTGWAKVGSRTLRGRVAQERIELERHWVVGIVRYRAACSLLTIHRRGPLLQDATRMLKIRSHLGSLASAIGACEGNDHFRAVLYALRAANSRALSARRASYGVRGRA